MLAAFNCVYSLKAATDKCADLWPVISVVDKYFLFWLFCLPRLSQKNAIIWALLLLTKVFCTFVLQWQTYWSK